MRKSDGEYAKKKNNNDGDAVDNLSNSAGFKVKRRKKNTKSALNRKMRREKKFANGARGVADLKGSKASRRAAEKKERQQQKKLERYIIITIHQHI